MAWTKSGTVNLTNGSAVVYGYATAWVSGGMARPGDVFIAPGGDLYEVASIQSNTQLTLSSLYLGSTASGQSYSLIHTGLLPAELAINLSSLQSKYLTTISQLWEWETSNAATVPLTNPATGVTTNVKPIAGLVLDVDGKAPISSPSFTGKVTSRANLGNGWGANYAARALGTAQGQLAGYTFEPTFQGTEDNGPRRSADIWSGFNGSSWGKEYLAFGVGRNGAGNDGGNQSVERMRIDGSGNVLVTGPAGLGYGPGAGGTVTQATSKSTAVTLNKPCGTITMNGAALYANAAVQFSLINSLITPTDTLDLGLVASTITDTEHYRLSYSMANGIAYIVLINQSGYTQSHAVGIAFTLHKGSIS